MTTPSRSRGFTLLELLVAMSIFAVIGVMAMVGLNTVIGQQTQSRAYLDRVHAVQRAVRLMAGDMGQAAPRWVRDYLGDREAPLLAGASIEYLVRLTRDGWQNPNSSARGTLQRVQYRLEDGKFIREYWPVVDRTVNTDIVSEVLLEKVESVQFAFLDGNGEWQSTWPPLRAAGAVAPAQAQAQPPPRAVRVTLRLKDWGEIQRLVEVPG